MSFHKVIDADCEYCGVSDQLPTIKLLLAQGWRVYDGKTFCSQDCLNKYKAENKQNK